MNNNINLESLMKKNSKLMSEADFLLSYYSSFDRTVFIGKYKEAVKQEKYGYCDELVFAANQLAEAFETMDLIFKSVHYNLSKSNNYMDERIYNIFHLMKGDIMYLVFLSKQMTKLNKIANYPFVDTAVKTSYKYASDCYKHLNCLLASLPKPNSKLSKSVIDKMILCHKDLYWIFSLDIDNHPEELILHK